MRIAQISPLYESVPPQLYGGTERVVSYLTEELIRLGHDVTLFASGDSTTAARLISHTPHALRLNPQSVDHLSHHMLMIERMIQSASAFDVIHSHIDYLAFPVLRRIVTPSLTTLHGRTNIPDLIPLYREFRDMNLVAISQSQRSYLPWARWQAIIHHGLPKHLHAFNAHPRGSYLAFLGRMSPVKGVHQAIEIAKRARVPLKIAAKVDASNQHYFKSVIKPLLRNHLIEYVGEIGEREKTDFLGNALALLFPIDWVEPFGLVMIEALACGTPVICRPRGSVPEIIEHGVTGFMVQTIDEAVAAVAKIPLLSRPRCRAIFEQHFTATRMAQEYVALYQQLLAATRSPSFRHPVTVSLHRRKGIWE